MSARRVIRIGLGIYALALFTSFMHVWEVYSRYGGHFPVLDKVWVALGIALGLDLTALYYSYLSVLGVHSARLGSYLAVGLVWFAVLVSLISNTTTVLDKAVAFVLSSFVLVTTFVLGRVLGELNRSDQDRARQAAIQHQQVPEAEEPNEWLPTKEVAARLGMAKSSFLVLARRLNLPYRQEGRTLLWNWRAVHEAVQSRNARDPAASAGTD